MSWQSIRQNVVVASANIAETMTFTRREGQSSAAGQTLINTWKRQALEGMSGIFSGKAEAKAAEKDGEIEKLHAKIGQLVVERDFLAKASGR